MDGEADTHRPLLGRLLRQVHHHWAEDIHAALGAAGFGDIGAPHANVFPFVPAEGIQVSGLAQLARVRKQTMAEAVAQLEELGYVERRPDPTDRRARRVYLTARGEAVRPVSLTAGRAVEKRWARLLGDEGLESMRDSLELLLGGLQSDAP